MTHFGFLGGGWRLKSEGVLRLSGLVPEGFMAV